MLSGLPAIRQDMNSRRNKRKIMKRLLSFLLLLSLLLSLTACFGAEPVQTEPQMAVGTTEPLFWPPIPTGTEETEPLPGFTYDPGYEDDGQSDWPIQWPQDNDGGSDYIPRDDEETRPVVIEPIDPVQPTQGETQPPATTAPPSGLDPNGSYDSKSKVALFIVTYGRLPNNYITKKQAKSLGWSGNGNDPIRLYAPGKCIGGDRFYNNEGLLPAGYTYYECDIGVLGANSRGAQRLVYTKTGIVYYTSNHYKSFTRLY